MRRGYTSFPWDTHPNDRFIRVPPSGPYSQAWQGIQRVNLLSKVGVRRAALYGTFPISPLQTTRRQSSRMQWNTQPGVNGAGPALASEQEQAYEAYAYGQGQQPQSPGLLSMLLSRLRGR